MPVASNNETICICLGCCSLGIRCRYRRLVLAQFYCPMHTCWGSNGVDCRQWLACFVAPAIGRSFFSCSGRGRMILVPCRSWWPRATGFATNWQDIMRKICRFLNGAEHRWATVFLAWLVSSHLLCRTSTYFALTGVLPNGVISINDQPRPSVPHQLIVTENRRVSASGEPYP